MLNLLLGLGIGIAVGADARDARRAALIAEFEKQTAPAPVIRRYRLDGSPLVRDVANGWRSGRPELVLGGNFDLLTPA